MARVEIIKPSIITLEFHQEKQDKDYGSCMWARFVIDTKNFVVKKEEQLCMNQLSNGVAQKEVKQKKSYLFSLKK